MGLGADEIRQAFREFDLDRNGYVGAAEIAHVLASMNPPVKATDDEIDEMVRFCPTSFECSRKDFARAYSPRHVFYTAVDSHGGHRWRWTS